MVRPPVLPARAARHFRSVAVACLVAVAAVLAVPTPAAALQPDEIVLIVNSNVPAGQKLAEFYTAQRKVPAGRVLTLALPAADDISPDQYDRDVTPAVRRFLKDNNLDRKVTCLVPMYGVPLRVGRRPSTPALNEEVAAIDAESKQVIEQAKAHVEQIEAAAKEWDPAFKAATGADPNALGQRTDKAMQAALTAIARDEGPDATATRPARFERLRGPLEALIGRPAMVEQLARPPLSQFAAKPPTPAELAAAVADGRAAAAAINATLPWADPAGRARARDVAREKLGAFGRIKVLLEQHVRINPSETEAAFDSELSLVWFPETYARYRWQPNPLFYKVRNARAAGTARPTAGANPQGEEPRPLMVMRIDAPTEALAREMIATSVRVEQQGLKGLVALDARGKPASDAYGTYDQTIRNLADLLRAKTTLSVVLDDKEPLFEGGPIKGVALYCGWYSLRNYKGGMEFVPGAVGFHIASLECLSLRNPNERGWCRGLLTDGVAGTLGAVAEPYLHSFPAADDFFPLLLTGKLTLAEVYWATNPLASWMNTCIGDPLYTPFRANPVMKVEDLPERLSPSVR